jgi:hypothetical protein
MIIIYMNHLNDDKYINEIVRTVKELFVKSVSNQNELLDKMPIEFIDKE